MPTQQNTQNYPIYPNGRPAPPPRPQPPRPRPPKPPGNNWNIGSVIENVLMGRPYAHADIKGSAGYPGISGIVKFFAQSGGTIVSAQIYGLPRGRSGYNPVFALNIHEGSRCRGNRTDPFADTYGYYNPYAGGMPPLYGNNGYAMTSFFAGGFTPRDIVGRTAVVSGIPPDFSYLPPENGGAKLACGEIVRR